MVTMKVIGTLVDEKPKESSTFTNLEWNPPVIIKKKLKTRIHSSQFSSPETL